MNEEYMNFEQAAEFLNTPRSTLYRWLKEGRVPGHKIGRQWRFLRAELDAVRRAPDEDEELAVGAGAEEPSYFQRWILTHLPHKESTPMTSPRDALLWGAFDAEIEALHLAPQADGQWRLSKRCGGALETMTTLNAAAFEALSQEIEALQPPSLRGQSGLKSSWAMSRGGSERVLVVHQQLETALGPRMTFRLVRAEDGPPSLDRIGLEGATRAELERFLGASHGLLLLSGVSGSGKTTTAHACLHHLARDQARAVFSLERSTEVLIPGVNQISVDLDQERAYRAAFSRVMASDPDVIFIASTFAPRHREVLYTTALQAAESGHLVLVQLEAESASQAVERFQAHVDRPVDDCIVGALWQELERSPDQALCARYDLLAGPMSVEA